MLEFKRIDHCYGLPGYDIVKGMDDATNMGGLISAIAVQATIGTHTFMVGDTGVVFKVHGMLERGEKAKQNFTEFCKQVVRAIKDAREAADMEWLDRLLNDFAQNGVEMPFWGTILTNEDMDA